MSATITTQFLQDLKAAHLRPDDSFAPRLIAALMAKRFVILTGIAGSGKTTMALLLARTASETAK